ncbi:hypothetical protein TanjilG_04544 [Lupinus angustifolius]|uniref:Uncharacterized protein n=1 Tax=Lupinus angustifolius TaxID=3871 RepID=A0A4P1RQI8_LUPAN|nr:PREDICTED: uncharacterized protein LOC109343019 [Lupinus angustifolius]OIW16009.1 hypothetical protein TanjilG_04544 [Lupinus angustifolius]
MEECNKRKRVPHDSVYSEPHSKSHRVDSGSDVNSSESQLTRADSCVNSCESELTRVDSEIQEDLFNILDDSENVAERDSAIQGLDSVIKSFEEEILAPSSGLDPMDPNSVPDSSELLQPNLGYLFEASDDELGLPPSVPESDEPGRVEPDGVDLSGFVGFEDDIPNYDAFGFGNEMVAECDGVAGGLTAVDELFDYSETAENLWRLESLQAM